MRYQHLVAITSLAVAATALAAPPIESPDRIATVARAHVLSVASFDAEEVDVQVGPVDPRLRVHACEHQPETFTPPRAQMEGRTSVGVRCRGPKAWTLYVPARVRVWKQVAVATRDLQRGDIVSTEDVRLARRDSADLSGRYYTATHELVGMQASRNILANRPLTATSVASPKVVKRGQVITMLAGRTGIEVRVQGKALADGAVGDRIAVENSRTKRRLEGTVAGNGIVRIL